MNLLPRPQPQREFYTERSVRYANSTYFQKQVFSSRESSFKALTYWLSLSIATKSFVHHHVVVGRRKGDVSSIRIFHSIPVHRTFPHNPDLEEFWTTLIPTTRRSKNFPLLQHIEKTLLKRHRRQTDPFSGCQPKEKIILEAQYDRRYCTLRPWQMDIRSILNPTIEPSGLPAAEACEPSAPCIECRFCPPRLSMDHQSVDWEHSSQTLVHADLNILDRCVTWPSAERTGVKARTDHTRRSTGPFGSVYSEGEMLFIWYHRVELEKRWKHVLDGFNCQIPYHERRQIQGLQCRFYRFLKRRDYPSTRQQRSIIDKNVACGEPDPCFRVIEWTGKWYPWMYRGQNQKPEPGLL